MGGYLNTQGQLFWRGNTDQIFLFLVGAEEPNLLGVQVSLPGMKSFQVLSLLSACRLEGIWQPGDAAVWYYHEPWHQVASVHYSRLDKKGSPFKTRKVKLNRKEDCTANTCLSTPLEPHVKLVNKLARLKGGTTVPNRMKVAGRVFRVPGLQHVRARAARDTEALSKEWSSCWRRDDRNSPLPSSPCQWP